MNLNWGGWIFSGVIPAVAVLSQYGNKGSGSFIDQKAKELKAL